MIMFYIYTKIKEINVLSLTNKKRQNCSKQKTKKQKQKEKEKVTP